MHVRKHSTVVLNLFNPPPYLPSCTLPSPNQPKLHRCVPVLPALDILDLFPMFHSFVQHTKRSCSTVLRCIISLPDITPGTDG
ncbi:hypothetical protein K443DRAFT_565468 [Laccaria amethystina LaAM-08-1]|uniref:Uncharacterized protein n=1 Tax=Laccaria amethystina LaAM-08-1 TaxID=1095629 RepID=A0A0C9Y0E4_9AGAR|nr:hypothetical protein K443DRAFT_565468 [Laccaria amethystina LaAM-08-1]